MFRLGNKYRRHRLICGGAVLFLMLTTWRNMEASKTGFPLNDTIYNKRVRQGDNFISDNLETVHDANNPTNHIADDYEYSENIRREPQETHNETKNDHLKSHGSNDNQPVIERKPAMAEETPVEEPTVVKQEPVGVEKEPVKVKETPVEEPTGVKQEPVGVQKEPVKVKETPVGVSKELIEKETQVEVEDEPAMVHEEFGNHIETDAADGKLQGDDDKQKNIRQAVGGYIMPTYEYKPRGSELDPDVRMDYVKGIGTVYIYNTKNKVDIAFNDNARKEKVILLYNQLFTDTDFKFGIGDKPFEQNLCIINKCRTTTDRNEHSLADMVIFFAFAIDFSNPLAIPPRAHASQIYVFWNHESPFYGTRGDLRQHGTIFNMTVTYRTDSTIPLPLYQTRARARHVKNAMLDSEDIQQKSKMAVWMISACQKTGSMRIQYAKELGKYILIDTFGKCGNLSCPVDKTEECILEMDEKYKFYLAFENSMCRDYMTEKVFRTLIGKMVPVVMGGGHYERYLPPHSYIDVRDYESPKHLADYLNFLDKNDKEYLKYFEWKADWLIWRVHTKVAFCPICELLHGKGSGMKVRSDLNIHEWWEEEGQCVLPKHLTKFSHM